MTLLTGPLLNHRRFLLNENSGDEESGYSQSRHIDHQLKRIFFISKQRKTPSPKLTVRRAEEEDRRGADVIQPGAAIPEPPMTK